MAGGAHQAPAPLSGVVQHYAWGDRTFLPAFLGLEPDGRPWAELWYGTHPGGPAELADGTPLSDLTGDLPYLVKVLSAAEPLSLQVHPSAEQARDGFARGAFPDENAKPELLCALTHFEALCGLRPATASIDLLTELGLDELARSVSDRGPGATLRDILTGVTDVDAVAAACGASRRVEAVWASRLASMYPGEPSVAATLLLNHVVLRPGDAIHLTAGNLHAYLGGSGIELMGSSDNVVRAGLTVKEIQLDELLAVMSDDPLADPVMSDTEGNTRYRLPEIDRVLVRIPEGVVHRSTSHEVAICLDGTGWYIPPGADYLARAESFVVA